MATRVKFILGSNLLETQYWTARNATEQDELDKLIVDASDTSRPPAEALRPLGEFLLRQLEAGGLEIDKMYLSRHTIDTPVDSPDKAPHVHWVIHTTSDYAPFISTWAELLGVKKEQIETSGQGRYAEDNNLAYLIHIKDKDKVQYTPQDVCTLRGKDYLEIYRERLPKWMEGRNYKAVKNVISDEKEATLINEILGGVITAREDILRNKDYALLYTFKPTRIDNALSNYYEIHQLKNAEALEAGEFKKTNIFVTGKSGSGKSSYTEQFIKFVEDKARQAGYKWTTYDGYNKNSFDGYLGEEAIILNDVSPNHQDPDAMRLLLDPYHAAGLSVRYRTKRISNRLNILSTTGTVKRFFSWLALNENSEDPVEQYLRRIEITVKLTRTSNETDVPPNDANTLVSIRHVFKDFEGNPFPESKKFDEAGGYYFAVPEGLPTQMRLSDSFEVLFQHLCKNNKVDYELPQATKDSLAAAIEDERINGGYYEPKPVIPLGQKLILDGEYSRREVPLSVFVDPEDGHVHIDAAKFYDLLKSINEQEAKMQINDLRGALSKDHKVNPFKVTPAQIA